MLEKDIKKLIDNSKCEHIVGLIGENPSTYSKSRVLWNSVYAVHDIDAEYLPFDVAPENLEVVLDLLLSHDKLLGFNITNPYKEPTAKHPSIEVDDLAKIAGGVNTVHKLDGKIYGHSTDGYGAVLPILEHSPIDGQKVVVIGAGGSGSAVAVACAEEGGDVIVANRTYRKAEKISERAGECGLEILPLELYSGSDYSDVFLEALDDADVVINTSPIEKETGKPMFHYDELSGGYKTCMDIVYGHKSFFLERAKDLGNRVIEGEQMLMYQAVKAFEYVHQKEGIERTGITEPMKYAMKNFKFDEKDVKAKILENF